MTATAQYPTDAWYRFVGRGVWPLGEEADEGVMVEGEGDDARAALIQYLVDEREETIEDAAATAATAEVLRVRQFHYACGCTAEQHAAHVEAECDPDYTGSGDECGEACDWVGLPPCGDRFAWSYELMPAEEPGGLAVLMVRR